MRSHVYSFTTYITPSRLQAILDKHNKQILYAEYITHDKDLDKKGNPKETHIHCNILLKDYQDEMWVRKWFAREYDNNGLQINTLVQDTKDTKGAHNYLTHKDNQDKHQYNDNEVIYYVNGKTTEDYLAVLTKWKIKDSKERENYAKDETAKCIVNNVLDGAKTRELVEMYGRDYIYNKRKYQEVALDIAREEHNWQKVHQLKESLGIKDSEQEQYLIERFEKLWDEMENQKIEKSIANIENCAVVSWGEPNA